LAIACSSVSAAEKPTQAAARKPNLIWIMADDKYESTGHKAQNLRENRQNAGLFARF
jgi:hypothetical protein